MQTWHANTENRLIPRKSTEPKQGGGTGSGAAHHPLHSQRAVTHRHRQSLHWRAGKSAGSPGRPVGQRPPPSSELPETNTLDVLIDLLFLLFFLLILILFLQKGTRNPTLLALWVSLYPDRSQHLGVETGRLGSGISGQQRQRLRPTCSQPAGGRESVWGLRRRMRTTASDCETQIV